jgi:hypothetical protein
MPSFQHAGSKTQTSLSAPLIITSSGQEDRGPALLTIFAISLRSSFSFFSPTFLLTPTAHTEQSISKPPLTASSESKRPTTIPQYAITGFLAGIPTIITACQTA